MRLLLHLNLDLAIGHDGGHASLSIPRVSTARAAAR